ncbi:MAG: DNA-processing protein DprA [Acutalibacteraceae bacterium]|nr:DNA-protecting protein DprA [Clostridiales bacterium]
MANEEFWIWLQNTLGVKARVDDILAYFKTPKNLYEAGETEWRLSGVLTSNQIQRLADSSLDGAFEIMEQCLKYRIKIITPHHDDFPKGLKDLNDMPTVLYTWGDLSRIRDTVCISVVGTRKATQGSLEVTKNLSASLANAGATVVSGGALGIDTAAHTGALYAQGKTVAVLGCGLLSPYLLENRPLRQRIARTGAVVSEFPPTKGADRTTFPIRNRIISGMSVGTVVIEAGERSGSLITASLAISQGRDVFAVPGDMVSSCYNGANKLIQDGARPIFCAKDVLEEYSYIYPDILDLSKAQVPIFSSQQKRQTNAQNQGLKSQAMAQQKPVAKKALVDSLSKTACSIYAQFGDEPLHINDIAQQTNIEINAILSALTELEILGYISLVQGRKYIIK